MSVNASWLRMFLEMGRRHPVAVNKVLSLGVQDVMFTHETAELLLRERRREFAGIGTDERTYQLSRNQRQFTSDPKHYMSVQDLFRMMGARSLTTLDAFENDEPDILWDLCQPIDPELHNQFDLVFDIGVLEHTADIFQSLENVGNLVKPGGWMILYLPMVSPINTCMYHPNPPFYYDNLAANGFENLNGWINWMPDWDQQNDIRTIWLNYRYNDDVYIWRPRYYTVMWFMAQKRQHVASFRPALQNFYKEWHAGTALLGTSQDELMRREAGLSDLGSIALSQRKRSGFARRLIGEMFGGNEIDTWASPTAVSGPTAEQIARFPLNEEGIPYSSECVVAPVDSRPQPDIPEQMLVGSPPREQLYL
jgi:SAM-dependent methyltransferase